MQILLLRLKNIKSHRAAEFAFSPGINVLAGPNGAGKSTLFEAVGYALFGVDARDIVGRADRFLTIGAKRGEVEVTFRSGAGELWRVTRTVGPNPRWLLAQGRGEEFETEEHANAGETEERLREILGLDPGRSLAEHFRQVIGPLQSDFLGPFVLRGAKRQEAFDRILGIDGWRRTFEGTLDLHKAVQNRIACLEAEIAGRGEQLAVLPLRREELQALRRQEKEKEKELRAAEKELAGAEKNLLALDGQRQGLEAAAGEIRILAERIDKGAAMVAEARRRVAEAEDALSVVESTRPGREAFERAEARLQELRLGERQRQETERAALALEKTRDQLKQQLLHEEREVAEAGRQLQVEEAGLAGRETELQPDGETAALAARLPDLRRSLDLRRGERALLQGRRESLVEGEAKLGQGLCPFLGEDCANFAGSEAPFASRRSEIEAEMNRLQVAVAALEEELAAAERAEKRLSALGAQRQEVARQRESLTARRRQLGEREKKLAALQPELDRAVAAAALQREALAPFAGLGEEIAAAEAERIRHQADRDRHQAHLAAAGEIPARRQTLVKYEELLSELTAQKGKRETDAAALRLAYDPVGHEAARRGRDALLGRVATLRQEAKGLALDAERRMAEIASLERVEAENAAKQKEKERFLEKEQLVRFLRAQVFNNVSTRLSERFREEIGRRADHLYRTIAETDEELAWGEGYQIVLRDLDGDGRVRERTDDQLSGGQTMSAVVALRLALLQTIGARLAFFDEPTSNLDAERRENLARAFRAIDLGREEVSRHWYDQLFLISHDVAFAEITDQVIELAGGSERRDAPPGES